MGSKGLIHIYTGNGKGKTTAAIGLCFRAAGHGLSCAIIQFLKGRETGEKVSCTLTNPPVLFEQYGSENFVLGSNPEIFEVQRELSHKGLARARELLTGKEFHIVVLDEIITLPGLNICGYEKIIDIMNIGRGSTELVLTGRGANDELIRAADLVTEMKEVKHYYNSGTGARKGIEY